MKTIGLLGGMSWESTVTYYQLINRGIQARLGGLHSALINMRSLDFAEIERLQHAGEWKSLEEILSANARLLEASGADCCLICTNTMHKVAPQITHQLGIPLIHIVDSTVTELAAAKVTRVGLLGTRFTMEEDFYVERLRAHELEVVVPDKVERQQVHDIIYDELCKGVIKSDSAVIYSRIIERLAQAGAQAVILGCTEIALLIQPEHSMLPLFDTTQIHVDAAIEFALS